jgi:spore cortex biosynthesis protein YabQ
LVQISYFIGIFAVAAGVSFLFHAYLACLRQTRLARPTVFALDILFWVGILALVAVCLFRINAGELRSYVWLALLSGVGWYYYRLYDRVKGWVDHMAHRLVACTRKNFRILVIPLHKICALRSLWRRQPPEA